MPKRNDLAAFLRAHDDYVVLGHVNPDGDAAGSCIALALMLRQMGKRAFVHLPGGMPRMYAAFEPGVELVSDGEAPFAAQTALAADVSDLGRLGSGRRFYDACAHRAVIDHHGTNAGFGEVCWVDAKAAACGEMVVALAQSMGEGLSERMGEWLYIAISTDSGQFGYSNTRAETLEAAAECLRAGIDADRITRLVFRTRSRGRTRLTGLVLSAMEQDLDGRLSWSYVSQEMLKRANATSEDKEGIVNYLVEMEGTQIAVLAEEKDAQETKFSLRSTGKLNVADAIAAPLGGGGHACAAGVTLRLPLDAALEIVLEKARGLLQ